MLSNTRRNRLFGLGSERPTGGKATQHSQLVFIIAVGLALPPGNAVAQQTVDMDGVVAASKAFYEAVGVLDKGEAIAKVWAHTARDPTRLRVYNRIGSVAQDPRSVNSTSRRCSPSSTSGKCHSSATEPTSLVGMSLSPSSSCVCLCGDHPSLGLTEDRQLMSTGTTQ